jgi:hypothetical protein
MSYFNDNEFNSSSQGESLYLSKGINKDVMIGEMQAFEPETGSPYLSILLYPASSSPENGTNFRFYMSDNARARSLEKITHLVTRIISKDELLKINSKSTTLEEFATNITAAINGATMRWFKICAEQYINKDGAVKDKLIIGLPAFVSQDETHKLRWDESNPYDYKKIAVDQVSERLVL